MSFTVVWAEAGGLKMLAAQKTKKTRFRASTPSRNQMNVCFQDCAGQDHRTALRIVFPTAFCIGASGRLGQRPFRRVILTSIGRDSITAPTIWMLVLCQMLETIRIRLRLPESLKFWPAWTLN